MPEASEPLVQLAGSERAPLPDVAPAGPLDTSERAELTLVLRRRAEIPADIVEGPTVLTGDQLAEQYGADPADVDLVRRTLTGLGLEITAVLPASRPSHRRDLANWSRRKSSSTTSTRPTWIPVSSCRRRVCSCCGRRASWMTGRWENSRRRG